MLNQQQILFLLMLLKQTPCNLYLIIPSSVFYNFTRSLFSMCECRAHRWHASIITEPVWMELHGRLIHLVTSAQQVIQGPVVSFCSNWFFKRELNCTGIYFLRWWSPSLDMGHPANASGHWGSNSGLHSCWGWNQSDPVGCYPAGLDRYLLQQITRNFESVDQSIYIYILANSWSPAVIVDTSWEARNFFTDLFTVLYSHFCPWPEIFKFVYFFIPSIFQTWSLFQANSHIQLTECPGLPLIVEIDLNTSRRAIENLLNFVIQPN